MPFYASLGNHDDPTQRYYKPFNMNGERFYTFTKGDARFFALDSNYMDQTQLKWLEDQLSALQQPVEGGLLPPSAVLVRRPARVGRRPARALEPLFVKYGMDVVFAGHEHFYERIKPQKGIYYFIAGRVGEAARGRHPPDAR